MPRYEAVPYWRVALHRRLLVIVTGRTIRPRLAGERPAV